MKKYFLSCLAVLLLASPAFAHERIDVDAKTDMMKKELNLTDDQAKSIKPIIQEYKDAVEQAAKNKEEKLSALLSKDQMDKMQSIKKDYEKMEH